MRKLSTAPRASSYANPVAASTSTTMYSDRASRRNLRCARVEASEGGDGDGSTVVESPDKSDYPWMAAAMTMERPSIMQPSTIPTAVFWSSSSSLRMENGRMSPRTL